MPRGNGTGPKGKGARTGRAVGGGSGHGRMGGDRPGSGPGGNCICPSCGKTIAHQRGLPCNQVVCPDCSAKMTKQ